MGWTTPAAIACSTVVLGIFNYFTSSSNNNQEYVDLNKETIAVIKENQNQLSNATYFLCAGLAIVFILYLSKVVQSAYKEKIYNTYHTDIPTK